MLVDIDLHHDLQIKFAFVMLHQFLTKLRALDLVNFSDQTVFQTFFLNACRYWPTPWFTDQVCICYAPSISYEITGLGLSKFQWSKRFPHFFPKCLQILSWFLACKSITITYASSLTFVTGNWFLAKLQSFDLVNFTDRTVFQTFFLNACRYWPDFWHVSQSPWFTDQVWVSLCSINFSRKYELWT